MLLSAQIKLFTLADQLLEALQLISNLPVSFLHLKKSLPKQ